MPNSPTSPASALPSIDQIRNIWAVGRNYAEHARELGNQVPAPQGDPLIFLKAGSSITLSSDQGGAGFRLPSFTDDIHFECEVAFQFGPDLTFSGIALALDLTAREVQSRLKEKQHPWTLAKSFRDSCPLSQIAPLPPGTDLARLRFSFWVNDELRQTASTGEMIFSSPSLRTYVVERFPVVPGDLLLTGTPAGVGPIQPGDHLHGEILSSSGEPLLKTSWQVLP